MLRFFCASQMPTSQAVRVKSKFGNSLLMDKIGHVYQVNSRSKDGSKIYWTCRERERSKVNSCIARGVTGGIHVLKWSGEHNHEVLPYFGEVFKLKSAP